MKKTTQQLIDIMKKSDDYHEYKKANQEDLMHSFMKLDRALYVMLKEKGAKKSEVIARSGIEVHYAYQIFSGTKVPTRDKVVMLCFGLCLTADETQQLLKVTGYSQLYGKNERDNVILYGLTKKMSVIDVNTLLYDLNLEILT